MLKLARKPGERLVLTAGEDEIVITFLEYSHGHAQIGVEAPLHVLVLREELTGEPRKKGA